MPPTKDIDRQEAGAQGEATPSESTTLEAPAATTGRLRSATLPIITKWDALRPHGDVL